MIYTVYALRLRGDAEIRYVGQTSGDPTLRVPNLLCSEEGVWNTTLFGQWLRANRSEIEARAVAIFETREEAKCGERAAIGMALLAGQRLFNRDHVPKHLRICSKRIPYEIAA